MTPAISEAMVEAMSPNQIKHMVDRFLAWKLPENFRPDAGISFEPRYNVGNLHGWPEGKHEPSGTNLFDAMQAEEMIRYLVEGLPGVGEPSASAIETLRFNAAHLIAEEDLADALKTLEIARNVMRDVADRLSRSALLPPQPSAETRDATEAAILRDYSLGNLTRLGVANYLRRAGFNLRYTTDKANSLPAEPSGALPGKGADNAGINLHDFKTHRRAWRQALLISKTNGIVSPPDIDDKAYWQHEIDVFDAAMLALDKALYLHPAPTLQGAGLIEEATFLLARLDDLEREWDDEEVYNQYAGHVAPSAARLRSIVAALSPQRGAGK